MTEERKKETFAFDFENAPERTKGFDIMPPKPGKTPEQKPGTGHEYQTPNPKECAEINKEAEKTGAKPKLFLVDASGYIFRAYYALPPMTDPYGTPVGAVLGFTKMIMELVENNSSSHIGIVFDATRRNFRHDIYPEYKANRDETPADLKPQFPLIREATKAYNLKCLEQEGFEADDLIASYAERGLKCGMDVVIMSADKDLMQLLKPGITIIDPMKNRIVTPEVVMEKFGVTPDKVVDVQALAGDSSDNIPGVASIGPKTAAELINRFGSLENVLAGAHEVARPKRREALERDAEKAVISKQLATLRKDAPTEDLNELKSKEPDPNIVRAFLEKHAFRSLYPRLNAFMQKRGHAVEESAKARTVHDAKYAVIQTPEELEKWFGEARDKGVLAIDTETTSLDTLYARLVGFSIATKEGEGAYIPIMHKELNSAEYKNVSDIPKVMGMLKEILEDETVLKVGHNIKYDLHIFANAYNGKVNVEPISDTMVQSYVLDGKRHGHGMDELAKLFFDIDTTTYQDLCGKGRNELFFSEVEIKKAGDYSAEDSDITLRLFNLFSRRIESEKMSFLYEKVERPLIKVLFEMERAGIKVDALMLKNLSVTFDEEMKRLDKEIHDIAGEGDSLNIQSPLQVGTVLFEKMKLPGGAKTKAGNFRVDVEILTQLANQDVEIAQKILDYRQLAKLKGTYTDSLSILVDKDSRIHTSFAQTITSTGRLASSNPNLQNIPIKTELGRKIREAFVPEKGNVLLSADYGQIELRIMADMADVKALKEAFSEGIDIHRQTASKIFKVALNDVTDEQRRRAKIINFSIVYGISAFGLASQLGLPVKEADMLIKGYLNEFQEIKSFMEKTIDFARNKGYVETYFGRKCYIGSINDKVYAARQYGARAAVNAPIQGTNADIIKMAMNRLKRMIDAGELKAKMLLQVHDELVFEIKEADAMACIPIIKETMENVHKFSIPIIAEVGVGRNWNEAH